MDTSEKNTKNTKPWIPYLPSYDVLADIHGEKRLTAFYNQLWRRAKKYDYVAMMSLTCSKFTLWYFDDGSVNNLTSCDGLLMKCDEIAEYFKEKGKFPRILIVSDILYHRNEICHIIDLLVGQVCDKLVTTNQEARSKIQRLMVESIDIFAYAISKEWYYDVGRVCNDFEVFHQKNSSWLIDAEISLNDAFIRWQIDLPKFSPSIENNELENLLIEKMQKGDNFVTKNWKLITLNFREKMIFACKFYSNNHIATIRLFPDRNEVDSDKHFVHWITSHTILGNIENHLLNELSYLICMTFNWSLETPVCKILLSNESKSRFGRNHLLNLIISLFDLVDFMNDNNIKDINLQKSNLDKISCYFDNDYTEIYQQLSDIINNPSLVLSIKQKVNHLISTSRSQILTKEDYDGVVNSEEVAEFDNDTIISNVGKNIWEISMKLKKRIKTNNYIRESEFQELSKERYDFDEEYGIDGVTSFNGFMSLLKSDFLEKKRDYLSFLSEKEFYSLIPAYLAGYFMLEDLGFVESTLQKCARRTDFMQLIKTTNLSYAIFPKINVWLLSGLAMIEQMCCKTVDREKLPVPSAINDFYYAVFNHLSQDKALIIQKFKLNEKDISDYETYIKLLLTPEEFERELGKFYDAKERFSNWNNVINLCYPNKKLITYMKKYIYELSRRYINIIDAPWTIVFATNWELGKYLNPIYQQRLEEEKKRLEEKKKREEEEIKKYQEEKKRLEEERERLAEKRRREKSSYFSPPTRFDRERYEKDFWSSFDHETQWDPPEDTWKRR